MANFDPDKTYSIGVLNVTFYVLDVEADDYLRNEDGTVRVFEAPKIDYSNLGDGLDLEDDLEDLRY